MISKAGSMSRFIFAVSVAAASVMATDFLTILIMILAAVAALLAWEKDPRSIFRVAQLVVWLFAFLFILHLFSHSGKRLFSILFLTATLEGAGAGLFYGARLVAFAYAAYIILLTVDPFELTRPLERAARHLGPMGRLICSFVLSFSLALRFLPDLIREGKMTLLAFKTRGVGFERGMLKRARLAIQLAGTVFVNAFKRAESTAMALSVKGYATRYARAAFPPISISAAGTLVVLISGIILVFGWRFLECEISSFGWNTAELILQDGRFRQE